jgi:hypothetical protein
MPKNDVDYSNTIIYKIYCKDDTIKDVYIGHTTNFIQRKYQHKIACNNLSNTLKIYNVIRCHGGWENWDMIKISKYNCKDVNEAKSKEQEHYDILKNGLNSLPPYDDKTTTYSDCNDKDFDAPNQNNKSITDKNIKAANNLKILAEQPLSAKTSKKLAQIYHCKICDYSTDRKFNFDNHLDSIKHKNNANNAFSAKTSKDYECQNCNKIFNDRAGLWRHNKKCNLSIENILYKENGPTDKEIIMMLIKDNSELKNMIFEQQNLMMKVIENGTHNTTNNTTNHTNSHNKAFNLNFFLNETCKNAMNMTDFVDSIKLQLSDLIDIGDIGYVEGLSKIIVKNLNALDETERPVHCTDKKRETIYIKDQNEWAKEDDNKSKLKKVIQKIADKNIRLLPQFREKFPDYGDAYSKTSDKYNKMVIEAMTVEPDKDEKIIRNISKATLISNKNA